MLHSYDEDTAAAVDAAADAGAASLVGAVLEQAYSAVVHAAEMDQQHAQRRHGRRTRDAGVRTPPERRSMKRPPPRLHQQKPPCSVSKGAAQQQHEQSRRERQARSPKK